MRALSHGCVRTQHILDLATELLGDDNGTWTPDKIQAALDSKKTVQANFVKPLPVYIVYFSPAALIDGQIVDYKDLYGRDAKAMAALQMKDGGASLGASPRNRSQPSQRRTRSRRAREGFGPKRDARLAWRPQKKGRSRRPFSEQTMIAAYASLSA